MSSTATPLTGTALPLRQEDPVTLAVMAKTLLLTVLLLAIAYMALRWYAAHRQGRVAALAPVSPLSCVATLQLSPRNKLYLVKAADSTVLVTESATGQVSLTLLGPTETAAPLPGASEA